jgi:hypothetical protein
MTHELHPEIHKFWKDQGYFNIREYQWDGRNILGWASNSNGSNILYLLENGVTTHYIAGGKYNEQEALRIIKLKAFL